MAEERTDKEAAKERQSGGVWNFVNSSFGLWLLSTVALGLLTTGYTFLAKSIEESGAKAERVRKMNLEVESRLSQFLVSVRGMVNDDLSLKEGKTVEDLQKNWNNLKKPPALTEGAVTAVYPEYESRGIVSLIVELSETVDQAEADRLEGVAQAIAVDDIISHAQSGGHMDVRAMLGAFHDEILLQRWDRKFPYTDCPKESPFC